MNIKDTLAGLGGLLIIGAIMLVGVTLLTIFILGASWATNTLLPWFSILTWIAFGLVVFVILPLAIPRATRRFAWKALFIASYLFGATLWMFGFVVTLQIWGTTGVFYGLLLGVVGVVPFGMLAALINGFWEITLMLVLLTIMTIASRAGALALAVTVEE